MRARSLQGANGHAARPTRRARASPYVLVGLLALWSLRRLDGGRLVGSPARAGSFAYRCYRSRRQGTTVCSNRLPMRMTDADDAVLDAVEKTLLNPTVVERALALAEAEIVRRRDGAEAGAARGRTRRARCGGRTRLTTAIKRGGDLDPLLDAIRESEARRGDLRQQIAALDAAPRSTPLDAGAVRAKLRSYVADYRKLLRGHVPQMQQILRRLVVGKLTFTPKLNGDYEFVGTRNCATATRWGGT